MRLANEVTYSGAVGTTCHHYNKLTERVTQKHKRVAEAVKSGAAKQDDEVNHTLSVCETCVPLRRFTTRTVHRLDLTERRRSVIRPRCHARRSRHGEQSESRVF